jgi:DNA-binding NtrC family response regulator
MGTILLVDDEERILRTLKLTFRREPFEVIATTSPMEALKMLEKQPVDVIISDQRMPEISGVDFLRQAREIQPHAVRLLLTGYSDLEAIIRSVNEAEIYRYIQKPWDNEDLLQKVHKAMQHAQKRPRTERPENVPVLEPSTVVANVLLLDPDTENRVSIQTALSEKGYQVFTAESLAYAVDRLQSLPIPVVISDIYLYKEDVLPMIQALKAYRPEIISLIVSSFSDQDTVIDFINEAFVFRFLPKPVQPGLITKSVEQALKLHRRLVSEPSYLERYFVEKPNAALAKKLGNLLPGLQKIPPVAA